MHQLADAELIWQQCLFAFEEPSVDASFASSARTWLDDDCWVDHVPLWLHGADRIFGELIGADALHHDVNLGSGNRRSYIVTSRCFHGSVACCRSCSATT